MTHEGISPIQFDDRESRRICFDVTGVFMTFLVWKTHSMMHITLIIPNL